jgi:CheY-like chemotaxis protein
MGPVLTLLGTTSESPSESGWHSVRRSAGSILLVDDVYEDAALLAVLLAPLDATVLVARSAEEALGMVDALLVDLVVTDLNMPDASGLDLTRELAGLDNAPAVIVLTGSRSVQDEVSALALGAVAYLRKPVDVDHLIGLARGILAGRRAERKSDPGRASGAT